MMARRAGGGKKTATATAAAAAAAAGSGGQVTALQVRTARRLGRLHAQIGRPITACPYKPGKDGAPTPLMEAYVHGYRQVKPGGRVR